MTIENENKKYRLAYFVTHPIQYQAPLLKLLSARPEIDLKVFFVRDFSLSAHILHEFSSGAKWDTPLLSGYGYSFLHKIFDIDSNSFFTPVVFGVKGALREKKWDAIWIHGYNHYSLIIAIVLSFLFRIPIFYRSESNLQSTRPNILKNMFVRILVKISKALLFIGNENKKYYKYFGAPESKLFFTPYAVDNYFFDEQYGKIDERDQKFRNELNIEDKTIVILFSGKLIKRKNPILLLDAFNEVTRNDVSSDFCLIFVGDGEESPTLRKRIKDLKLEKTVKLVGFINQSEIRKYYSIADLLVLPSSLETYGLVINEAMNASTAIIASDKVGAASDLVRDEVNGFVFQSENLGSLIQVLKKALSSKEKLRKMGKQSLRIISKWNYEVNVLGIIGALKSISNDR